MKAEPFKLEKDAYTPCSVDEVEYLRLHMPGPFPDRNFAEASHNDCQAGAQIHALKKEVAELKAELEWRKEAYFEGLSISFQKGREEVLSQVVDIYDTESGQIFCQAKYSFDEGDPSVGLQSHGAWELITPEFEEKHKGIDSFDTVMLYLRAALFRIQERSSNARAEHSVKNHHCSLRSGLDSIYDLAKGALDVYSYYDKKRTD